MKTKKAERTLLACLIALAVMAVMAPLFAESVFAEAPTSNINIRFDKPYHGTPVAKFKNTIRVTDANGSPLTIYDIDVEEVGSGHTYDGSLMKSEKTYSIAVFIKELVTDPDATVIEDYPGGANQVKARSYSSPDDGRYKTYVIFGTQPQDSHEPDQLNFVYVKLDLGEKGADFAAGLTTQINSDDSMAAATCSGSVIQMMQYDGVSVGSVVRKFEQHIYDYSQSDGTIKDRPGYLGYVGVRPSFDEYDVPEDYYNDTGIKDTIQDNQMFYLLWKKPLTAVSMTVDASLCGKQITAMYNDPTNPDSGYNPMTQNPTPEISCESDDYGVGVAYWKTESNDIFAGDIAFGDAVYAYAEFIPSFPYYFADDTDITVNGKKADSDDSDDAVGEIINMSGVSKGWFKVKVTADHDWEPATTLKPKTCKGCGVTEGEPLDDDEEGDGKNKDDDDRRQDAAAAEKAVTSIKGEADPKGSSYLPLQLKSVKQTKSSVTVKWTKQKKAVKYVIYGNLCGAGGKMKKLAAVTGGSKTFKKVAGKKVKKGKAYRFVVVALDKNNKVVSISKTVHAYAKGGKFTNHKAVKVQLKAGKKWKTAKTVTVKKGKTKKIRGVGVKQLPKKKIKMHVSMRYESSKPSVATVSAKGVIKGKKKGTCYVYAYSQNGVAKRVKVTVK